MTFFSKLGLFTNDNSNVLKGLLNTEANECQIDDIDPDSINTEEMIKRFEDSCQYIEHFFGKLEKDLDQKTEEITALNLRINKVDKEKESLEEQIKSFEHKTSKLTKEKDEISTSINDVCKALHVKSTNPKDQCEELKSAVQNSKEELEAFASICVFKKSCNVQNLTLKDLFKNKVQNCNKELLPSLEESLSASKLSAKIVSSEENKAIMDTNKKLNDLSQFLTDLSVFGMKIGPSLLDMFYQGMEKSKYSNFLKNDLGIHGLKNKTDIEAIPVLVENSKNLQEMSLSNFKTINNHLLKLLEHQEKDLIIKSKDEKITLIMAMLGSEADQIYEKEVKKEVSLSRMKELNLKELEGKTLLFLKALLKYILHTTGIEFTTFEDVVQKFKKINAIVQHERGLLINFAELMKGVSTIDEKLDFEQELSQFISKEAGKNILKKQLENIANSIYDKVFQYDEILKNANSTNGYDEYDESGEQSEEYYEDRHNDGSIKYTGYNSSRRDTKYNKMQPMTNHRYISSNVKSVRP